MGSQFPSSASYLARRPMVLGLAKILMIALSQIPIVAGAPIPSSLFFTSKEHEHEGQSPDDPELWLNLTVAAALVLLGGAFAGLTIALMGQDEIYLQVIRDSGEGAEKHHAAKVLKLLKKGKHWVLVTLLLSNVITNETLPIVLDRSLGGGWPAVLGSTVLIVIFGEIAPQSVCVRYGLPIGSWMAPFVLTLMYIMAPVAWPTAKLLDYLLGEDHGTIYKKAGLKTLVSLHKSLGEAGQQLNTDEVTIISAVLDLKDKPIGSIMTPMDDVFTLSLDDVLDEATMDDILSQGYSRIPIHHPDNDANFVGMLLVKMLITYDPEDAKPVRDFALATLPETRPDTSCLDIVNFFQEGKSHMVLVSEYPGDDHGAIGVVTLEDVIEELIGEEIVDESDVFIDVHRAIRRAMPAPTRRIPRSHIVTDPPPPPTTNGVAANLVDISESEALTQDDLHRLSTTDNPPKAKQPPVRRRSSGGGSQDGGKPTRKLSRDEINEHLKHLGPSNLASRPKSTRFNTVKIKPGTDAIAKHPTAEERGTPVRHVSESQSEYQTGIGEGVVKSGGRTASDAVQALQQGYGTIASSSAAGQPAPPSATKATQADLMDPSIVRLEVDDSEDRPAVKRPAAHSYNSGSTIGSLPSKHRSGSPYFHKGPARSGSITESVVDANGFRKVVLETTSSSDSNEEDDHSNANKSRLSLEDSKSGKGLGGDGKPKDGNGGQGEGKKKKRNRKKKTNNHAGSQPEGERAPLLGGNRN